MDRFEIQKLDAKPIETVAGRLGISVARHRALCPFHDDHHASLKFNLRRNTCRCYVCMDCNMGPIRLVMAVRRVDFIEACRLLTEMYGGVWKGPGGRSSACRWNGGRWNGGSETSAGGWNGGRWNGGRWNGGSETSAGGWNSGGDRTSAGESPSGSFGRQGEKVCGGGLDGGEPASDKPEPVFDSKRYERFFIDPWLSDEARRFLFTDRRLDERVVRWCRLTSWTDRHGIPWLCTPYFDQQGRLIGVQNRNLAWKPAAQENGGGEAPDGTIPTTGGEPPKREDPSGVEPSKGTALSNGAEPGGGSPSPEREPTADGNGAPNRLSDGGEPSIGKFPSDESGAPSGTPKVRSPAVEAPRFRFPRGARCTIYGLQIVQRLKEGDELYITEGCSDCWAMLSSGHKAIAIPSATLLSPDDARLLTDLGSRLHLSWHMYPDRDLPGERLFLQLREILPNLEHHQLPPGCKDYSEMFCGLRPL